MKPTEERQAPLEIRLDRWRFVQVPSRLVVDKGLTDGAKVTYSALVLWGGRDGKAWPSKALLAEARGVEPRTLRGHIVSLESAGWVSREISAERTIVHVHTESVHRGCGNEVPGVRQRGSTEREDGKRTPKESYTRDFEAWWKAWPRKKKKPAGAKAYAKALKRFSAPLLLSMAETWIRDNPCEPRYVPYGSSWLNGDRWEDEPDAPDSPYAGGGYDAARQAERVSKTKAAMRETLGEDV